MGKAKKPKPGGKAKKEKPGGKGKKDKPGGKGKKGSKESSSGKKSSSAASSKEPSSSQLQTKGSEQATTKDGADGSTPTKKEEGAKTPEGPFKPVDREPLPQIVLPYDLDLSIPRRPSVIYVWKWGNVWFFPISVLALGFIVFTMIYTSLSIQSGDLQAESESTTAAHNATSIAGVTETTTASEAAEIKRRRKTNDIKRKRRQRTHSPNDTWTTSTRDAGDTSETPTEGAVSWEQPESSASVATQVRGEDGDTDVVATSEAITPASAWLDAPPVEWQNVSSANTLLVATKADIDDERAQNASTASGDDGSVET